MPENIKITLVLVAMNLRTSRHKGNVGVEWWEKDWEDASVRFKVKIIKIPSSWK